MLANGIDCLYTFYEVMYIKNKKYYPDLLTTDMVTEKNTGQSSLLPGDELELKISEPGTYAQKDSVRAEGPNNLRGYFEYETEKLLHDAKKAEVRYRCFMETQKDESLYCVRLQKY